MDIEGIKLVCFSPTGTTKTVCQAIARGIDHSVVELVDITRPNARDQFIHVSKNELLIVAVPVYMGRVPGLLHEFLHGIKGINTPVVPVVVYGHRTYDNALLELSDILKKTGCIPLGAGAFIGEHSFSSVDTPIAAARPDANDIELAEEFGRKLKSKLESLASIDAAENLTLPGSYPYGGVLDLWSVDFIDISDACRGQGVCADVCPVGAIDPEDTRKIDKEKCISCCACIKKCPEKARSIKASKVKDAALRLSTLIACRQKEPKKPQYFL